MTGEKLWYFKAIFHSLFRFNSLLHLQHLVQHSSFENTSDCLLSIIFFMDCLCVMDIYCTSKNLKMSLTINCIRDEIRDANILICCIFSIQALQLYSL